MCSICYIIYAVSTRHVEQIDTTPDERGLTAPTHHTRRGKILVKILSRKTAAASCAIEGAQRTRTVCWHIPLACFVVQRSSFARLLKSRSGEKKEGEEKKGAYKTFQIFVKTVERSHQKRAWKHVRQ